VPLVSAGVNGAVEMKLFNYIAPLVSAGVNGTVEMMLFLLVFCF